MSDLVISLVIVIVFLLIEISILLLKLSTYKSIVVSYEVRIDQLERYLLATHGKWRRPRPAVYGKPWALEYPDPDRSMPPLTDADSNNDQSTQPS